MVLEFCFLVCELLTASSQKPLVETLLMFQLGGAAVILFKWLALPHTPTLELVTGGGYKKF